MGRLGSVLCDQTQQDFTFCIVSAGDPRYFEHVSTQSVAFCSAISFCVWLIFGLLLFLYHISLLYCDIIHQTQHSRLIMLEKFLLDLSLLLQSTFRPLVSQVCWPIFAPFFCHPARCVPSSHLRRCYQVRELWLKIFLASAPLQGSAFLSTATSPSFPASPTTPRWWQRPRSSLTPCWSWSCSIITREWPRRREWAQCPCSSGWWELHFTCTWEFIRSAERECTLFLQRHIL